MITYDRGDRAIAYIAQAMGYVGCREMATRVDAYLDRDGEMIPCRIFLAQLVVLAEV